MICRSESYGQHAGRCGLEATVCTETWLPLQFEGSTSMGYPRVALNRNGPRPRILGICPGQVQRRLRVPLCIRHRRLALLGSTDVRTLPAPPPSRPLQPRPLQQKGGYWLSLVCVTWAQVTCWKQRSSCSLSSSPMVWCSSLLLLLSLLFGPPACIRKPRLEWYRHDARQEYRASERVSPPHLWLTLPAGDVPR